MPDNQGNQNNQNEEIEKEEESFAELLESYQDGMSDDLKVQLAELRHLYESGDLSEATRGEESTGLSESWATSTDAVRQVVSRSRVT